MAIPPGDNPPERRATPAPLHFSTPPSLAAAYLRILLSRKPSIIAGAVPRVEAVLERFSVDREHLARYRDVCCDRGALTLPITYPHVLATPIHLALISSRAFPISLFGIVHVRNRIEQRRPLGIDEVGKIRAWIEGHRETSRGQELDLHTEIRIGIDTVWSEISTLLARRRDRTRRSREAGSSSPPVDTPPRQDVTTSSFAVEQGVGLRYARVSGDFNPIHVAHLAARVFGFKRAIAHGMWSLARCAAELGEPVFSGPCILDVAFRRPIAFPTSVVLESWRAGGRVGFALRDRDDRGHLLGSVVGLI